MLTGLESWLTHYLEVFIVIKFIKTFWFILLLLILMIAAMIADYNRPDLIISIDTDTGCEYLTTRHGGITPRMDQSGTYQICTAPIRNIN